MAQQKKPATTTRTPTRQMRRRSLVAVVIVGLFFIANIIQLVRVQILEAEDWQNRAVSQQLSDTVVTAKRGTIYDADMQPLAESAEVWKIIMSPKDIADLNWKKIPYHALEDGLNTLVHIDAARYDNRGHFDLKVFTNNHLFL